MTEQMQTIIVLFLFAFLIGFFIAHFLRKNAYDRKYKDQISTLEEDNEKTTYLLTQAQEKAQNIQFKYTTVHDNFEQEKKLFEKLGNEEATLLQSLTSLQNEKKFLNEKIKEDEEKIAQIKAEISQLSENLKDINNLRDIVTTNEIDIQTLLSKQKDKQQLSDTYSNDIEILKKLRKSLRAKAINLTEAIEETKHRLHTATNTLKAIENKYIQRLKTLTKENENLKITALNYEYALKDYESKSGGQATKINDKIIQKLFNIPDSKSKEIESIVRKNDGTRWVDKLIQTLFKKQHVTDKEI